MAQERPLVSLEITPKDGKWDKTNVYRPLLKVLPSIIKGLKEKDIWIPLSAIARLEVQGKMDEPRHELLRSQVLHFLKRSNRYKKVYFRIIKTSRSQYDKIMKRSGLYQPQMKEYRSLSVSLPPAVIFKKDRKAWIYSFNEYLPGILYRSDKKKAAAITGTDFVKEITDLLSKDLEDLEKFRKISLKFAKILKADLKLAGKSPQLPFRSWHKETQDKEDPGGTYYFKYKVRAKPKSSEAEI